jgi:hypothetical protein
MSGHGAFTGLPIDVIEGQDDRWAALLVKAVLVILALGVVMSAILWPVASADWGALVLCIALAACTGLMVIRQALLAERR